MRFKLPIPLLALSTFLAIANAHSHLANPLPTRRLDCRVGNGRPRACYGPCAPWDTYGEPTGIGPNRPAEYWRRGQRRTITWHRNNHGHGESGFVRFTLVPVRYMMDKNAHQRFTFQISCWSSGEHRCRSRNVHACGNDAQGRAYRVGIRVPATYPDGTYVFGWAWYGGGDYRARSFFGDYYSCSFVRISGGSRLASAMRPVFVPGIGERRGSCLSATDRVGVCWREPCNGHRVRRRRPRNLPSVIRLSDVARAAGVAAAAAQSSSGGSSSSASTSIARPPRPPSRPPSRPQHSGPPFNVRGLQVVSVRSGRGQTMRGRLRVRVSRYRRGFTFALLVRGRVSEVRFKVGRFQHTERHPPYVINGDYNYRYRPFPYCRRGQRIRISCYVRGGRVTRRYDYNVHCH